MTQPTDTPAATPAAPDTSTPAAPVAEAPATPPTPEPSLLAGAQAPEPTPAGGENPAPSAAPLNDGVPEKFHVKRDDGTLDEAATLAKLSKSYRELEAHKGPLSQAPEKPEDYKIELKDAAGNAFEGEALEQFTSDPLFQSFAKDAHAQGLSNEQLQFVVQRYMDKVPELMAADAQITRDEASAELSKLWTNEQAFNANLGAAKSAITAYGGEADEVAGSRARLEEKFGNDPDFLAFAARIGGEMKEDRPATGVSPSAEMEIESMMKSAAYFDPKHQDHERIKAKVNEFYAAKYGTKPR